jgi:hypothetical protein
MAFQIEKAAARIGSKLGGLLISAALISGCVAVQQSELSDSSRQASVVVTTGLTSFQPPQIRLIPAVANADSYGVPKAGEV